MVTLFNFINLLQRDPFFQLLCSMWYRAKLLIEFNAECDFREPNVLLLHFISAHLLLRL